MISRNGYRYDMRLVEIGDTIAHNKKQRFTVIDSEDVEGFTRYKVRALCKWCGRVFNQWHYPSASVTLDQVCKVCKGHGYTAKRGPEGEELKKARAAGSRQKYNVKRYEKPKVKPVDLHDLSPGDTVRYRGVDAVVLRSVEKVTRDYEVYFTYDMRISCVVCGEDFPHASKDTDTRFPLRCRRCRKETGRTWRYQEK